MSAIAFQTAAMWAAANKKPLALIVFLVAVGISFPAALVVYFANAAFRPSVAEIVPILSRFGSVLVITLTLGCICIAVSRLQLAPEPQEAAAEAGPIGTPLLRRLPPDLRGALIRLSMNDHYVEVETAKGATLVLLRFADALNELGDADGLQVHRSHWVARTAVKGRAAECS